MGQNSVAPQLPGYTYLGFIGGGGFADVFRYQDPTGRPVAVKVTHGASGETLQASEAEAQLMAKLSAHPSIVTIYTMGTAPDGRTYLVMEECGAAHLGQRVAKRLLTASKAMEITIQLAGGIETAHRLGILHRDIKPANILFTGLRVPALTDFGISVSHETGQSRNALSPLWAPPEQHAGSGLAMGPWSDIFSLAATTWAMLVGRSPLEVPGGRNDTLAVRERFQRFTPPPTRRADVPDVLERVLATALARDPQQRYQSALEFARALQGVQGQLNESVTPIPVLTDDDEDDFDDPELRETGTQVSGFMLIDPDRAVGSQTITVGAPTGGLTSPHERSHPTDGSVPLDPLIQHGRGYASAGLRDFTAPAVPVVVPGTGTAGPVAPVVGPAAAKPRRRGVVVATVAILAVVVGGLVLWRSGVLADGGTQTAVASPTAVAQDPAAGRVPPVESVQGVVDGGQVRFSWSNPDPKAGDKYIVAELSAPTDRPVMVAEEPAVSVEHRPGQTCVEVRLRRPNGSVSTPVKGCVTA